MKDSLVWLIVLAVWVVMGMAAVTLALALAIWTLIGAF